MHAFQLGPVISRVAQLGVVGSSAFQPQKESPDRAEKSMKTQRYFKAITTSGCAALIALLNGCASNTDVAFKPADRAAIRTVSVNSNVKKPDRMTCMDNTARWTAAVAGGGGAIGSLAAVKMQEGNTSGMQLEQAMARNGIMVDRIVRDTFIEELRKSGAFSVANAGGDAQFNLSIHTYGLTVGTSLFDKKLAPNLHVNAELTRSDGTLVWKDVGGATSVNIHSSKVTYIGRDGAHLFEEYLSNPQLLRAAFTVAAQAVAQRLIADLRRQ